MKRNLASMSSLTNEEMGFDDDADMAAASAEIKKQVKQKATPKKQRCIIVQCVYCVRVRAGSHRFCS